MGQNYQRGAEPWENQRKDEKQRRELWDAPQKTERQKRRARELKYQWLLLGMILLTLGTGIVHLLMEGVPFSQQSSFSAVLRLDVLSSDGLYYRIFQVASAMSCVVAWLAIRAAIAYSIGLLALPVLLLLGWILQSLKLELGYKLMMTVLVLSELIMGLVLIFSCFMAVFSSDVPNALLQVLYYLGLFLYPLLELIVLRKWKENIY